MLSKVLKIAYIDVYIFMYMYKKYMWFNFWNPGSYGYEWENRSLNG